ncbi:Crp/Fnr family transcriptional regulator [Magnetovirga frankeli]|uniref:Crp/Fnr family transcriptional regulator n=1 Tax=Magnetovirga frankeli TaxID=947516 RepID=UPI0012936A20|nr:Crp/Fnr family transcriptional regulator [gamma proteobacterium SS-5]
MASELKPTADLLRRFSLLSGLPEPALNLLASQAGLRRYRRREVVLEAGQLAPGVCFLFEGRLQGVDFTLDGREVGLYFVSPGGFCGELGLFDGKQQPEFVITLAPSLVVNLPMPALRQVMHEAPALMQAFCQRLAERVRTLTEQRNLLALSSIPQRVCAQLWLLSRELGDAKQRPLTLDNPPTHQELAIMLNLSRETVTRVFQTLQARQIVKRDGSSRLLILNLGQLKKLAEGEEAP